jgi:hypothetical protein
MSREDTFNGVRAGFLYKFAYFNTVAQEIGMERALALYTKMEEEMGAASGKMIKEQAGVEEIDAKTAQTLIGSSLEGIGMRFEVLEESPQRVVFKPGKCPVYEAARMLGMDHETIEAICRAGSIRGMDATAKQLNPNLSFELRTFRAGPDDSCIEEIVMG